MYPASAARTIGTVVTLPLKYTTYGIHLLIIKPLDPEVVFEKVIFDGGGYEQPFFKMPERPFERQ